MSIKKAVSGKTASQNAKSSRDTTQKTNLCPRQFRVLSKLITGVMTVRELQRVAGNNPAETVRQLRRKGVDVRMRWVNGVDQDGDKIRYGEYDISHESRELVRSLLREGA